MIKNNDLQKFAGQYFIINEPTNRDLTNELTTLERYDESYDESYNDMDFMEQMNFDDKIKKFILDSDNLLLVEWNQTTSKYQIAKEQVELIRDDLETYEEFYSAQEIEEA